MARRGLSCDMLAGGWLAVWALILWSLPAAGPAGAQEADEPVRRGRYLMGTLCEARAFGDPARVGPLLDAALDRIAELDDRLTTWRPEGGLARLDAELDSAPAGTGIPVDPELAQALSSALDWARRTDGRFDPTIGAIADAWGLRSGGRRPDDDELARALRRVSWRLVRVDAARATVTSGRQGVALDLGGFGKGYALDRAADVLRAGGLTSALIDFGGQVLALGTPPGRPGWLVDVADPRDRTRPALTLLVRDASVATSGNAERSFVVDGRRFGHLLDPRTGRPVEFPGSATVIAGEATAADVLSTALAIAGPREVAGLLPPGASYVVLRPPSIEGGALEGMAGPGARGRLVDPGDVAWKPLPTDDPSSSRTGRIR